MNRTLLAASQLSILLAAIPVTSLAQLAPATISPLQAGPSPVGIVASKFNSDGYLDLAALDQGDRSVHVFLGSASGTFSPGAVIPIGKPGSIPTAIASADFDKDGNQDLAITSQPDNAVTILLGDGAGNFRQDSPPYATGKWPAAIAIGDFTGGGYPGLAICNRDSDDVTVLIASKTGGKISFSPMSGSPFSVGKSPSSIAASDLDGDGRLDLAVANELDNTVSVLMGDRKAGFVPQTVSPFPTGLNPHFVVAADFNRDGNIDLATANLSSNDITILFGNGVGGFQPAASTVSVGSKPTSIVAADLNGDLIRDLTVTNSGSGNVTVLLGDGAGGFKPALGSPVTAGTQPIAQAMGDFNLSGDGKLNLAVVNQGDNTITILSNRFTIVPVMVSAASPLGTAPVAPASIVSVIGSGFFDVPQLAPNTTCINGNTLTVTDSSGLKSQPLVISYASLKQLNAMLPDSLAPGAATFTYAPSKDCDGPQNGSPQRATVSIVPVVPSLFSANSTGKGPANALFSPDITNSSGFTPTYLCDTPPLCPLDVESGASALILYATGIRNRVKLSDITVTIGTQSLTPFFAGPDPKLGALGIDQIKVLLLPTALAHTHTVFVTVTVGTLTSNAVTLNFN